MIVRYIDTHCHLQLAQFSDDRDEIIARMCDESVGAVVVGDDIESSKEAVVLAEKHEHLYAAVGIHPEHVMGFVNPSSDDGFTKPIMQELAGHKKVVAIGECGLDYFRTTDDETKIKQKELFKKHITLAGEIDKPLMIHVRSSVGSHDAYQDLIQILKEEKRKFPTLRGNIHFFTGTLAEAEAFFSLGFTISFTAVITFTHDYDEVIKAVPLANILSETDAPFVAPVSRRWQRNDPLAVIEVVNKIAAIRGKDPEIVRTALLANAQYLFAL